MCICVHIYICMYACMQLCMYECMHVCRCACMHACIYVYIYIFMCNHTHIPIYIYYMRYCIFYFVWCPYLPNIFIYIYIHYIPHSLDGSSPAGTIRNPANLDHHHLAWCISLYNSNPKLNILNDWRVSGIHPSNLSINHLPFKHIFETRNCRNQTTLVKSPGYPKEIPSFRINLKNSRTWIVRPLWSVVC